MKVYLRIFARIFAAFVVALAIGSSIPALGAADHHSSAALSDYSSDPVWLVRGWNTVITWLDQMASTLVPGGESDLDALGARVEDDPTQDITVGANSCALNTCTELGPSGDPNG